MNNKQELSWFVKLLLLAAFALMMLIVVTLIIMVAFGARFTGINVQLTSIALQNILIFMAPVLIMALICRHSDQRPISQTMWMSKAPSFKSIAMVVIVYIVALPAMNWIVDWNEGLHLPQELRGVESILRDMEDSAQALTSDLLLSKTWEGMLIRVLLVGVITGLGEEIFFRAGMLGSMHYGGVKRHVAVWTVALIFSGIHMQFFGFVPRLLLGAWFGYVMLWSGEVWTPIIAHSLNNSIVVVFTFLANNHYIEDNIIETLGVPEKGQQPLLAIGSAIATMLVIWLFMRKKNTIES
ncbi:MAG: CPBP family intramembrane metalloprotease [Muribaculaceae bacterium]|nr:CPBP family intramembrane metalloprotease [Muribaculaceae bacterium]